MHIPHEFQSIENFVEFLSDDERYSFNHEELRSLSASIQLSPNKVVTLLEGYGLKLQQRAHAPRQRGFKSNDHDRWSAYPSHGGSGISEFGLTWLRSADKR